MKVWDVALATVRKRQCPSSVANSPGELITHQAVVAKSKSFYRGCKPRATMFHSRTNVALSLSSPLLVITQVSVERVEAIGREYCKDYGFLSGQ